MSPLGNSHKALVHHFWGIKLGCSVSSQPPIEEMTKHPRPQGPSEPTKTIRAEIGRVPAEDGQAPTIHIVPSSYTPHVFFLLKSAALERRMVGNVLKSLERKGLQCVAMRMIHDPTGSAIACVWRGANAIDQATSLLSALPAHAVEFSADPTINHQGAARFFADSDFSLAIAPTMIPWFIE
ncbi:hypothetical protein PAPYR_11632 [Paratrimastix pyriformis]|uniref:Uncharacterized protein n=1 Tax=Paratrimastix pyriformis TaxID=342808 RepID=A0ABQ8U7G5_9EUKA|nr:hypothetical protein PAPYR_11632 [Paratrimastix pyriformis]